MYRVFLIDDEPWALMALKNLTDWEAPGFSVIRDAENGAQALAAIEQEQPDLIVSDIRMPGLDGIALVQTLRDRKWRAEVLLVSSYTDFEYAREALRFGCCGYLVKPVEEEELLEYLEKVRVILSEKGSAAGGEGGFQSERTEVRAMLRYLRDHYAEGVTLQVLAREFGMSESYISSLIKKNTGKGFSDHLTEIRIRKAQELLRQTNDSVEKIAERVGYPDYFYFTKVYKKITGVTPTAYRKSL